MKISLMVHLAWLGLSIMAVSWVALWIAFFAGDVALQVAAWAGLVFGPGLAMPAVIHATLLPSTKREDGHE